MNTNTGATYMLREEIGDALYSQAFSPLALEEARRMSPLTEDERRAIADRLAGDPIVPVTAQVATAQRLGRREMERRRRRRQAARQARKRNR